MRLLRPSLICCLLLIAAWGLAGRAGNDWKDLRVQIAATLHIERPLPNLQTKTFGEFEPVAGITAERVAYSTDYSLRVPAIVYRQTTPKASRQPAIVIVNGHRGDKSSWYAYWAGILYARAGAVVLTYDPIGEFERNRNRLSQTGQHDSLLEPDDMARRLSGLMITDVMQAVSYLGNRRDVDKKRIAVLGYSMGSFVSALACAMDLRVRACVLAAGGDLDGPNGYWDTSNKMCQATPYRSLAFLGERGPAIYALNAQRGATLILNGDQDSVVDIVHHGSHWFDDLKSATEERAGSSKNLFETHFENEGGHRPYFLTKEAALWLEEHLKFPNWDRKEIVAMPQTLISEWALKNGLVTQVSANYSHNEGGTLALGENIPAIPRDSLRAIPESVWDAHSEDYVYETWVERARVAIRSGAP